jgi:hypothetical protein
MRMNAKSRILAAALGCAVILLSGCGSGGGSSMSTGAPSGVVTRGTEGNYSTDALILAARDSTSVRIPSAAASSLDADLGAVRAQVPAVKDIHARPLDDLNSVLVSITPDAPFLSAWKQGTVATGQVALDSLLTQYKATSVQYLSALNGAQVFVVRFDDPLNTKALIAPLAAASTSIVGVHSNAAIGDGNQITLTTADGGKRIYAFSIGWGDCASGCYARHIWSVTIAADGGISVVESGTPLPAGSAA